MRRAHQAVLLAAASLFAHVAFAQPAPTAPDPGTEGNSPAPPIIPVTPDPSPGTAAPAPASPPSATPAPDSLPTVPTVPVPLAGDWAARGTVQLQALDKVMARSVSLSGKVGEALHFGTLTILVTSCMARPPDQRQDYAAAMTIADSQPDGPGFKGWMFAGEPELSMLQHPLYDIRLTACR
jgi:hypothetical protein